MNTHWDVIVDFMSYKTEEFSRRYNLLLENTDHYVFLSSSRVYADSQRPITEESPLLLDVCEDQKYLETDEYALAKARQENLLHASEFRNWTIIRPYITYSEERLQLGVFEKEHWLYRALQGRAIVFSKDIAERYTTMTYGKDVANAIAMLACNDKAKAETFQIAGPHYMKWKDILSIYLSTIEKCTGSRPRVQWLENMDELEKFMGNHYQIHVDRLYNRRFDSSKLESACGTVMQYMSVENGLETCLRCFIERKLNFRRISWEVEGFMDKITKEHTVISTIPSLKYKVRYFKARYYPFFG